MRCEARVRTLNSGLRERVQSVHGSSGRMNEYVYIYIYIYACVCVCVFMLGLLLTTRIAAVCMEPGSLQIGGMGQAVSSRRKEPRSLGVAGGFRIYALTL